MSRMWSVEDCEQVRGLLTRFCDADEVCSVMDCESGDLDGLSRDAFGMTFDEAKAKFSAQGRALLRKAQFDLAVSGDRNMLQVLGREFLGQESAAYKPRKTREQRAAEQAEQDGGKALTSMQSKFLRVVNG